MTSPTLEPYREKIIERLQQNQSKADILKWLRQKEHVTIGNSQYYDFVKRLDCETTQSEDEKLDPPLREIPAPAWVMEVETLRAMVAELPRVLEEVSGKIDALGQKTSEQQLTMAQTLREFHETLSGMTKHLQERPLSMPSGTASGTTVKQAAPSPSPVPSATIRRIWKRALLVSGTVCVLVEILLVHGYWRPLWAGFRSWV